MSVDQVLRGGGPRPVMALGFACLYLAAGFGARLTLVDGTSFSLIWPAAGVAVLWLMIQQSGPFSLDVVLLAVASYLANALTGAPASLCVILTFTNVIQAVLTVHLLRRWCPGLWGCGGDRALDSPRVTAWYLLACSAGMFTGMVVGVVSTFLVRGDFSVVQCVLWFDRNLCGVLAVTTLGLLLGARLTSPRPRAPLVDGGLEGQWELVAAALFTVVMYSFAFAFDAQPLAFLLLATTVWAGVRFGTLVSAWHSLFTGAAALLLTLADRGPFANQTSPEIGAMLVQIYFGMVLVAGLVLATGRDERRALSAELRRTEAEAVDQAQVLNAIIDSMTEGLAVIDETGDVVLVNPAAMEALGPQARSWQLSGSLADLGASYLDGSDVPADERPAARALRGETVRNQDLLLRSAAGEERILSVSATPLPRDKEHDRARAVILVHDSTTEHAQRVELAAFAGVVAHDLRNPLAAIDGWTELLEDEAAAGGVDPDLILEFVGRVRSSSGRMHGLILHLLAHATSKNRNLSLTRVDLGASVRRVVVARDVAGLVTVGQLPDVRADRILVDQVLDNLIGNAVKYVPEGVEPKVEVCGRIDQPGWVTVAVADNGIGLPAGEHETIFEEFHRVHGRGYEGTGLGLSIVRRIVTRHGGTISARDNPAGGGTVFEFTLPAYD